MQFYKSSSKATNYHELTRHKKDLFKDLSRAQVETEWRMLISQ